MFETNYPKESWTHGYTDGSAENAVWNGGAGVYIQYAGGKEDKISLATGLYSTNYKAEAEALKTAAAHIEASTHASLKVVLLTDALSVLQALQSNRDTEINDLSTALASLCRRHEVTLQMDTIALQPAWNNEAADSLAKEGTTKEQVDRSTSYPEVKTILKAKQHSKWRHKHPRYNKADPYYLLTRWEQVTVFRLRTGHNHLNYHLYSKLSIGHTEQCPCGTGSQTTGHLLQFCPTYEPLRKGIWPDHTPVARKWYGSLRDLRCTATFIGETGISIWRTRRRRYACVLYFCICTCSAQLSLFHMERCSRSTLIISIINMPEFWPKPEDSHLSKMSRCQTSEWTLAVQASIGKVGHLSCLLSHESSSVWFQSSAFQVHWKDTKSRYLKCFHHSCSCVAS